LPTRDSRTNRNVVRRARPNERRERRRRGDASAGRNQDHMLAMRKRDHGSFPTDAGAPGVLPGMLPSKAVHGRSVNEPQNLSLRERAIEVDSPLHFLEVRRGREPRIGLVQMNHWPPTGSESGAGEPDQGKVASQDSRWARDSGMLRRP